MSRITTPTVLEQYFEEFRRNIIGIEQDFVSSYGLKKIIYTDWAASGRLYRPIEEKLINEFGPFVSDAHNKSTALGANMLKAYQYARSTIKEHVNAGSDDVLILDGTGMTGVVNKFQRILGLKLPENFKDAIQISKQERPIVFVSHMEHHSNHVLWLKTIADVEIIPACEKGLFSLDNLAVLLEKYSNRVYKIASVTACSNITGLYVPYHQVARLMHQYDGVCFVDFTCSAPYVDIDMHPKDPLAYLDAVFFSPHKFLGGPGTCGVLVFNKKLYSNNIPDRLSESIVKGLDACGDYQFIEDIETREDAGAPGVLQAVKTALAIQLKNKMGTENMLSRESELVKFVFDALLDVSNLKVLAAEHLERLGIFSFFIEDLDVDLGVKLLNDKFGIQAKAFYSSTGIYGRFLLRGQNSAIYESNWFGSKELTGMGWIRISVHPTTTTREIAMVCDSIKLLAREHKIWSWGYCKNEQSNEFSCKESKTVLEDVTSWFEL
jgi:selenocysteine lyase/cysteine desulfurase